MSYDDLPIINEDEYDAVKAAIGDKIKLMLEYYIEDTEGYAKQIADAYSAGDFGEILVATHTLKSSSKQIGAVRLGQISEDIEYKGKKLRDEGITDVKELAEGLEELPKIIEETLNLYRER